MVGLGGTTDSSRRFRWSSSGIGDGVHLAALSRAGTWELAVRYPAGTSGSFRENVLVKLVKGGGP